MGGADTRDHHFLQLVRPRRGSGRCILLARAPTVCCFLMAMEPNVKPDRPNCCTVELLAAA